MSWACPKSPHTLCKGTATAWKPSVCVCVFKRWRKECYRLFVWLSDRRRRKNNMKQQQKALLWCLSSQDQDPPGCRDKTRSFREEMQRIRIVFVFSQWFCEEDPPPHSPPPLLWACFLFKTYVKKEEKKEEATVISTNGPICTVMFSILSLTFRKQRKIVLFSRIDRWLLFCSLFQQGKKKKRKSCLQNLC